MNDFLRALRCVAASVCLALAASCGGGGGDGGDVGAGGPAPSAGTVVGAAGGTVAGPSGASVVIPPGALAIDTTIRIEQSSAGAPALPGGFTVAGQTFAFTPHGTSFAVPVTMTLPFDPALVPSGSRPALYKTNAQNQWEQVAGVTVGANTVSAPVTGFSFGTAGLERLIPIRSWSFFVERTGERIERNDFNEPPWNKVEDGLSFGPEIPFFIDIGIEDDDQETRLDVFSSVEGVTFWAAAEDVGDAGLTQTQAFVKTAPGATLQFVITEASLQAVDFNRAPTANECPRGLQVLTCHPLSARIDFSARAFGADSALLLKPNGKALLDTAGSATLQGRAGLWAFDATPNPFFDPAWSAINFLFTTDALGNPKARLTSDIVIDVDLSSIVVGTKFYVESNVFASAVNNRGRESAIGAYVRDPARSGGGAMNSTGLQLVNDAVPPPPPPGRTAPVACNAGPNPAAGVLQFSAATNEMLEDRFAGRPGVQVTRTGGSSGPVSATFTTGSGGTALPGVHYKPKIVTVNFADGDTASRFVELEILTNADVEADRTVNLVLSEPGGCATLGALSSSVLTILDDDRPPPPPPPSGLDTSFGTAGMATFPETGTPPRSFGGNQSAMALQADGKIVMAGGSGADFILARFNADGSLDTGFGIEGTVTTDMGSGDFLPEEALGVAVQADGKIVVVGHATIPTRAPAPRLPPTFALTRYDSSGNLDASFGTGGRVSGNVNGRAHAVAIQADGRIVVAGEFSFESEVIGEGGDITVARFNSNGTLDLGFGGSGTGQLASDIGGRVNTARQVVLQPDGAIVVSGRPPGDPGGIIHTDVMRLNANGLPDSSFGSSGKLAILGSDVGQGLALQPDGKLVLVGTVVNPVFPATSRFLLRRLNADGTPDTGFGTGGSVDTALSQNAAAGGVALQADGRIVVVGSRALSANSNFIVARYATDGALDTGFGVGGTLSIDFFQFTDIGENVLVQPDGKIVVSGSAQRLSSDGYGLARINP